MFGRVSSISLTLLQTARPTVHLAVGPNGSARIELNDELLADVRVDLVARRQRHDAAFQPLRVEVQPLGQAPLMSTFARLADAAVAGHALMYADHVAWLENVRGNVDTPPVHGK